MRTHDDTRAQLTTFLGLTFGLSAVLYWLIISAGSLGARGGLYVLALMWSPGVSDAVETSRAPLRERIQPLDAAPLVTERGT